MKYTVMLLQQSWLW